MLMDEYTDIELSIFLKLSDNKGHAEWDLANEMKKKASNLNPILIRLRDRKIIYYKDRPNTNKNSKHPKLPEKAYFITNEIEVLSSILVQMIRKFVENEFDTNSLSRFMCSKYVNIAIKKYGFSSIYDIIADWLPMQKVRCVLSRSFLTLSASKNEYKRFAEILHATISGVRPPPSATAEAEPVFLEDELHELHKELDANPCSEIEMLRSFEHVDAVRFYRETIHESIIKGLDKLVEGSVISKGLHKFLLFDNYLSPLTSYPIHGTLQLLFSQPFERIYNDAYLLDGNSMTLLSERAAAIYYHFPDILFELFRSYSADSKKMKLIVKEMIFHWNVASTRFDLCYNLVRSYYEGSGNYHLKSDGLAYNMINLDNNKQVLPEFAIRTLLVEVLTPLVFEPQPEFNRDFGKLMEDPFACLRPCLSFGNNEDQSEFIKIDAILTELESKLADYKKMEEKRN
jgi:hypothetical protein